MMTLIGVPLSLAADVLADHVLCAVNTQVSTPARASVSFSHREKVSVAAAVCGARSVTDLGSLPSACAFGSGILVTHGPRTEIRWF